MSAALLTALGYIDKYTALRGGDILTHPASIADMEASVFDEFCTRAFALVLSEVGIDIDDYKDFQRRKRNR